MPGINPNNAPGFNPQLMIDFNSKEKEEAQLMQEKLDLIKKYRVGPEAVSKLNKINDTWYIGGQTIDEWDNQWKKLEEKDDDDYKYGRL